MPINEELFTLQFTLYIGITKLNKYLSVIRARQRGQTRLLRL